MKNLMLVTLFFSVLGCTDPGRVRRETWVIENRLNEDVKTEVYYVPFNYPIQPMERGEFILEANQSITLFETGIQPKDEVFPTEALRFFLEIQSPDSLIMTFEDGKKLFYTLQGNPDPLNPLHVTSNTTGWTTVQTDRDMYLTKFYITEGHKNAAN